MGRSRQSVPVLAPGSFVGETGRTIGDWTAEWWRWAFAQSVPNDAFTDLTGANANVGQSGPVFFVAGTTGGNATRQFTVPGDKYLLIPLVNYEDSQLEQEVGGNPSATPADVQQGVAAVAGLFDTLSASINGVPVPNLFAHREASPQFSWVGGENNPFGWSANTSSGAAYADGYWLMLEPLGYGTTTTVQFGGGITGVFEVSISDTITGVPEPGTLALVFMGLLSGGMLSLRNRQSAS